MLIGTDAVIADAARNIVVEQAMWYLPRPPLFWWIGEREEGNDRRFDSRRNVHRAGIIGDGYIGRLDKGAQIGK